MTTPAEAWRQPCPFCGARPQHGCRTSSGHLTTLHSARWDAADSRRLTDEEAEAVLTLVRGGWLNLELDLDRSDASSDLLGDCTCGHDNVNHRLSAPCACKECACERFVKDVAS